MINTYKTNNDDEGAVLKLYQRLLDHWNQRDAEGFAGLMAINTNVIGFDGSQIDGRAAVASSMKQIFGSHQTASYVSKVREIRSLSGDVMLLRAVAGMIPPGKNDINPAVNTIQSMIAVKQNGKWIISLFQNTPAQFHGRPDVSDALTAELRALCE